MGSSPAASSSARWLLLLWASGAARRTCRSSTSRQPHPLRHTELTNPNTCLRVCGRRRTQNTRGWSFYAGPQVVAVALAAAALLLSAPDPALQVLLQKRPLRGARRLPSACELEPPKFPARNPARSASPTLPPLTARSSPRPHPHFGPAVSADLTTPTTR